MKYLVLAALNLISLGAFAATGGSFLRMTCYSLENRKETYKIYSDNAHQIHTVVMDTADSDNVPSDVFRYKYNQRASSEMGAPAIIEFYGPYTDGKSILRIDINDWGQAALLRVNRGDVQKVVDLGCTGKLNH